MTCSPNPTISVWIALLVAPIAAAAQVPLVQQPERPRQGVFRGDQPDLQSRQALSASVSLFETYDSNIILADTAGASADIPQESGIYTGLSAGLFYSRHHRSVQFVAGSGIQLDYYPQFTSEVRQPLDSYNGTAGVSLTLGRSTLRAAQSISRQPYFAFDVRQPLVDPGAPLITNSNVTVAPDVALLTEPMLGYLTSASLTVPFGRRTTLDLTYGYSGSSAAETWPTVQGQAAGIRLSRSVTRTLDLNGSYNFKAAKFRSVLPTAGDLEAHDALVGVRYTKPLSRTRTITLSGDAGRSILKEQFPSAANTAAVPGFLASADLNLQFARSWSAMAGFRRSLLLLQGLTRPYYGNTISVGVRGEPTRRIDIAAHGYMLRSDPASDVLSGAYDTFTTSARLTYALTRNLAVSTTYAHSEYDFGPTAQLPPGTLRILARDVVRVGLVFGAPLIGRYVAP